MKYLLLILTLLSLNVNATSLYLGAWSKHFKDEMQNETHNLIALEVNSIIAGTFKNSFSDQTYFVAYDLEWESTYFDYGFWLGLSYGYCGDGQQNNYTSLTGCNTGGFVPVIMPYVAYSQFPVKPSVAFAYKSVMFNVEIEF